MILLIIFLIGATLCEDLSEYTIVSSDVNGHLSCKTTIRSRDCWMGTCTTSYTDDCVLTSGTNGTYYFNDKFEFGYNNYGWGAITDYQVISYYVSLKNNISNSFMFKYLDRSILCVGTCSDNYKADDHGYYMKWAIYLTVSSKDMSELDFSFNATYSRLYVVQSNNANILTLSLMTLMITFINCL